MARFLAAVCQLAAGIDPREAVRKAARAGARLVVLPAFALEARGDWTPGPGPSPDELLARAAEMARAAGCYLIPGTVLVTEGDAGPENDSPPVRQVAWLLGPDGRLLGEQSQTHTTLEEEEAGWRSGSELTPIRVPELGCRIGLLVGLDAWIPEVCRILTLNGADLLVAPLAMPKPYSEAHQLAGLWQEVQQNQTLGLEACLVGERSGRAWAGRSAILAPCEMVEDESGFIARAGSATRGLTLFGPLDLSLRRAVVEAYDILGELNRGLYRQAFPHVYLEPRSRDTAGGRAVIGTEPEPVEEAPLTLSLQEKTLRRYLTFASRPSVMRAVAKSLGMRPRDPVGAGPRRVVRTAALQVASFYARSPKEYALKLGEAFREAVDRGARLVAFPELVTLPLLGLLPGVVESVERKMAGPPGGQAGLASGATIGAASGATRATSRAPTMPRLADVVCFLAPVLQNVYFSLFPALAAAARVWVMAGSTPLPGPDGRVYNVAALFGPDGRLVGTQAKLHLLPRERAEGLTPGQRFEVFTTGVGQLALPICMDATYFETYRLAALLGAEIVAAPVSNVEPYHYWRLLRGAWPRVQESPLFAVQSTLVGDFLGEPMTGKASIFAPAELTPRGDGIMAQNPEPTGAGLAVADLDLRVLASFRTKGALLARINPEVILRYLPGVYGRQGQASAGSPEGEAPR